MVRFSSDDDDARRLGEALAALRREKGLSQAEAGARIGMTSQGWGLYESGRRSGLFRPDIQRRLAGALDETPDALMLKLAAGSPPQASSVGGVESGGRAFRAPAKGGDVRMMQLTTDDMAPWAARGVTIAYRPGQAPRAGQGCVVRFADGRQTVRLFDGRDSEGVTVHDAAGASERFSAEQIVDVSAVIGRLEDR